MKLKKNIYLYYAISFLNACLFMIPIRYFFFVNFLKFGIGNAILINTLSGLVSLIFEVHSGGWADRFGRKKMYILGMILTILGFSFYIWSLDFYLYVFSGIFLGLGYALTSGNIEAIIHDSLEEQGLEKDYDNIQSNSYILMFSGRAISSLIAGYLYFYGELLPFIATIICYFLSLILVLFIDQVKQRKSTEINDFQHIKTAFNFLLSKKDLMILIIFLGLFFSGIGNIYWFTYQPYLESIGIEIKDIGIVYFFISAFSAIGSYLMKKIQSKVKTFKILGFMFLGLFLVSCMFSYFDNLFGVIPILILCILFGFVMIVGNNYIIKRSPKTHKSTMLSIFSFAGSLGYFSFGVISGYIVEFTSLNSLYYFLPILIFFVFISFIYSSKKQKLI